MFFGLSPLEVLVLGALAVVLFGPDKLPHAAVTAARLLEQARTLRQNATTGLTGLLDAQTTAAFREGLEIKTLLSEEAGELRRESAAVLGHLRGPVAQAGGHLADPRLLAAPSAERPEHDYLDADPT